MNRMRIVKILYIISFIVSVNILNAHVCSARISASEVCPEAVWISLDLPVEQRKQIDDIIVESFHEAQLNHSSPQIKNMDFIQVYALMNYLSKVNDIRDDVNNKIMQVLSPEQQSQFGMLIERKRNVTEKTTTMIMSLNLTDAQQTAIINTLLQSQRQTWSIVSNRSLSWEERRKKLNRLNPLRLATTKLTKSQLADLNTLNVWFTSN